MKRARRSRAPQKPVTAPLPRVWLRVLILVLAGALTYWNGLSGPFIFDDIGTVVQNESIRDVTNIAAVFSPPAHTPVAGRPLVNLSFAINYAQGGLDVTGYHVANLAVHILCAVLVFGVVRRTLDLTASASLGSRETIDIGFAAALLWTVHPLNSEVVNYLTQRTESMMALCYLTTIYANARSHRSLRRAQWQWVALLSCAAGMACKETMVTAPLMVVLYDRIFVFDSLRTAFRSRWRFYGGLSISWLLLAALVAADGQTISAGFGTARLSPWNYLLNQTVMLTRYLWLTVWPQSLVIYYGWTRPVTVATVWPYALFIVSLLLVTAWLLARRPKVGFLGAWFFLTLAPTSSILPIGTEVGAERRMYLPLVSIATLIVIGAVFLRDRVRSRTHGHVRAAGLRSVADAAVLIVVCGLLAARTVLRNQEYSSPLTMARTVLQRWPTPNAEYLMGTELAAAGQQQEAIPHLRKATLEYAPARFALGSELLAIGKPAEAIEQLEIFVKQEPDLLATRSAHVLLGRAYESTGQWSRAIEQYRIILERNGSDVEAHGLLADALRGHQAFDEAVGHYRMYLEGRPQDANAWTGLGVALISTGQTQEATAAFRQAARAAPGNPHFRLNLARALLETGALDEAAAVAQQTAGTDPGNPAAYDILGRVFAAQGKFDAARGQFQQALARDRHYAPALEALRALPGPQSPKK